MSLNSHPSTRFSRSVYDACGPLRDAFDLSCFCYDLSFPGGGLSILTDQARIFEPYYFRELLPVYSDASGRTLANGVYTTKQLARTSENKKEFDFFEKVSRSQHGIHVVERKEKMQEMISFSFAMTDEEYEHFLLNDFFRIKGFIRYFKAQMRDELGLMQEEESRLHFPDLLEVESSSPPIAKYEEPAKVIHLEDGSTVRLSPQQWTCLKLVIEGHSIKEAAALLQLSPRTVENYLAVIRDKLYCSSLIALAGRYGDQIC